MAEPSATAAVVAAASEDDRHSDVSNEQEIQGSEARPASRGSSKGRELAERALSPLQRRGPLLDPEHENEFRQVAQCMKHAFTGMSSWTATDLALGIVAVSKAMPPHHETAVSKGWIKEPLQDNAVLSRFQWAVYLSQALYDCGGDEEKMKVIRPDAADALKHLHPTAGVLPSRPLKPFHGLFVDHKVKTVAFGIRGTHHGHDVFTDLAAIVEPFSGGFVHRGLLLAARWLYEEQLDRFRDLVKQYPEYQVVVTGHSMGGGIAVLLAWLLREQGGLEFAETQCITLSSAAVMSRELSEQVSDWTISLVMGDDVVPRLSLVHMEELREQVLQFSYSDALIQAYPGLDKVKTLAANTSDRIAIVQSKAIKVLSKAKADLHGSSFYQRAMRRLSTDIGKMSESEAAQYAAEKAEAAAKYAEEVKDGLAKEWSTFSTVFKAELAKNLYLDDLAEEQHLDHPTEVPAVKLYPPGRLFHLAAGGKDEEDGVPVIAEVMIEYFDAVFLSRHGVTHHLLDNIEPRLKRIAEAIAAPPTAS